MYIYLLLQQFNINYELEKWEVKGKEMSELRIFITSHGATAFHAITCNK